MKLKYLAPITILFVAFRLVAAEPFASEPQIKVSFEGGSGDVAADQVPGSLGDGWMSGWETAVRAEPVAARETVQGAVRLSIGDRALIPGEASHLEVAFSATESEGTATPEQINFGVGRRFELPASGSKQTIQFAMRIDSFEDFHHSRDFVGAFGQARRTDVQPNLNPDSTWVVRARGDTGTWWVGQSNGDGGDIFHDTSLAARPGEIYRFSVTTDLTNATYSVRIEGGGGEYAEENLALINSLSPSYSGPMWVQFHAQTNLVSDRGSFSVGGISVAFP